MNTNKTRLYGAVAAAALVAGVGGFGLSTLLNRPAEAPAAEAPAAKAPAAKADAHAGEGEAGHSEAEGKGEGEEAEVVAITAEQTRAANITLANVMGGGGGEVRLAGRVEPMIDARASVGAAVGGRVERVLVAPGQTVKAGQTLAILVSGDAATFRAESDAAFATAEAARRAYERDRSLGDQGVVARQEVETSRAQALGAEASARAARARAAAAGAPNASGRLTVASPISGVVTSVAVGPGGFVAQGGVVADVTNPQRIELVFNAPPTLASEVRAGARMRVQGPAGDFDAVIIGVAAAAGAQGGATVIRARPDGQALPPAGTAVSGAVVTGRATGAFTVPSSAVQTVEGGSVVFVATDKGFRAAPVMVGRQASGRTEILRGLTGQERVAAANAFLLKAELAKGQAEHGH